jgi:hypothetical protein
MKKTLTKRNLCDILNVSKEREVQKVKINVENQNMILKENMFIQKNNVEVNGWYGLTYFELELNEPLRRQDLYDLRDCLNTMLAEIERLEDEREV